MGEFVGKNLMPVISVNKNRFKTYVKILNNYPNAGVCVETVCVTTGKGLNPFSCSHTDRPGISVSIHNHSY